MYNFQTLICYNCNSVMLNLPEREAAKLSGLNFRCECCGHLNLLEGMKFHKTKLENHYNTFCIEDFLSMQNACI